MNDMADLERRVGDWLQVKAPPRAPGELLQVTLDHLATVPQEQPLVRRLFGERLGHSRAVRYAIVIALVAGAILAGLALIGAPDPLPPPQGAIVYQSGGSLLVVDPDAPDDRRTIGQSGGSDPIDWDPTTGRFLLAAHPEDVPSWYDDGWRIGNGLTDLDLGLFVLEPDGTRTRLTAGSGSQSGNWGSFSPDGTMVGYGCCGSAPGPYVIAVHGDKPHSLLDPCARPCGEPVGEWAAWSPTSSEIAWLDWVETSPKWGDHARLLSYVNTDGSQVREGVLQLTGAAGGLVWSPDGSRLAFWMAQGEFDLPAQIYVVNADGSNLRQLTTGDDDSRWPSWSPDGSRLAFTRAPLITLTGGDGSTMKAVEQGSRQLFTMASDGTDVTLVKGVHPGGPITWIPDR
jgi:hypothetical protein